MKKIDAEKILQNIFQANYDEYKKYQDFINNLKDENTEDDILKNAKDVDAAAEELIEKKTIPKMYLTDLQKLGQKLKIVYETVKDVLELPKEVIEEIERLPVTKQFFVINKGEAEPLDDKVIEEVKNTAKEFYKNQLINLNRF